MDILAIDPGTTESGWVVYDGKKPCWIGKDNNELLIDKIRSEMWPVSAVVIEEMAPYGTIGKTTIETIKWYGRFDEAADQNGWEVYYMKRKDVKMHICDNGNATDSGVCVALQDRFAYGVRNHGKGTKKEPGYFFGFKKDIWQAFALAVAWMDLNETVLP